MSRTTPPEHSDAPLPTDTRDEDGAGDGRKGGGAVGPRRALSWIALVVTAEAGALLSVGAFLGLYVRPTSDDWCALWKARDMGVLGITWDFYRTQNGRVTNAFLTGLVYSDDMRGPKLLPALLVVAIGAGLFLLGRAALRALRLPGPPPSCSPRPRRSCPRCCSSPTPARTRCCSGPRRRSPTPCRA